MTGLFSRLTLRGLTLANRMVVSPMSQYSAARGEANTWHLIHLGSLSLSGAGLIFIEGTAIEPHGRITPADLGLWDQATEDALKPVLAAMRAHSTAAIGIQLAHAGRKASSRVPWEGGALIPLTHGGWLTYAPSAIPQKRGERPPLALDADGLDRIRGAFTEAAKRATRLGIDVIELHAAHGYLLHEFLSPLSNDRADEYGGSLENRLRFPLQVFDAIRAVFPPDKPIGVKVSATDWVEGGWDLDQTIAFATALRAHGADWITVSSGGLSPLQKMPMAPGYQVPFAQAIKQAAGVPTIAIGLISEPQQADAVIANGQADLVALARAVLYDPRWGWHAAAALGASVHAPPQYWRAAPADHKTLFGETVYGAR
jgi:2,4-dienoyl-CoA reductase (NADPH2)